MDLLFFFYLTSVVASNIFSGFDIPHCIVQNNGVGCAMLPRDVWFHELESAGSLDVYVYAYAYPFIHVGMWMLVCLCIYVSICMHMYVCMFTYICTFVYSPFLSLTY